MNKPNDESELLKNVTDVFSMGTFNIPDYQRGYEWSANDVKMLLNDLRKFALNSVDLSET